MAKLNDQQLKAVKEIEKNLLIIAGPGTGKTRTLTEKVRYLVKNDYDKNKILVLTFTEKAALELKERLKNTLDVENMYISTFHAFCKRILEECYEYHKRDFEILDELDQFTFIYSKINKIFLESKNFANYYLNDVINLFNTITENNINVNQLIEYYKYNALPNDYLDLFEQFLKRFKTNEDPKDVFFDLLESYKRYEKLLKKEKLIDFAHLQKELYELLRNDNNLLDKVRSKFDYILIDEHQDTNPIQDKIIQLISKNGKNIRVCAVGDEDQSIYGFRGASIENFRSFINNYKNATKINLEINYRSYKEIVDFYNNFMKNHRKFKKVSISNRGKSKNKVVYIKSKDKKEECKKIIHAIKKLKEKNEVKFGDIAILYKSVRIQGKTLLNEFDKNGIPYVVYGDSSLLEQKEILDVLYNMSILYN